MFVAVAAEVRFFSLRFPRRLIEIYLPKIVGEWIKSWTLSGQDRRRFCLRAGGGLLCETVDILTHCVQGLSP